MASVIPFISLRPASELAAEYAALPYDVFSRDEAAAEIAAHPLSFLRIDSTAALFPAEHDEYDPRVYAYARELLEADERNSVLISESDSKPHYYLYRLRRGQHEQTGVVACVSVEDYHHDVIKCHENTRTRKRKDRVEHIAALEAHTGPVLIAYRPHKAIDAAVAAAVGGGAVVGAAVATPLYDFVAPDGVQHSIWRIDDEATAAMLQQAFSEIDALYIADGHHRAAAAALIGDRRHEAQKPSADQRGGGSSPRPGDNTTRCLGDNTTHCPGDNTTPCPDDNATPRPGDNATPYPDDPASNFDDPSAHFLAVLFPADQLTILDYNRVVTDLNGYTPEEFLRRVGAIFELSDLPIGQEPYRPEQRGAIGMYTQGTWYRLTIPECLRSDDPVAGLDVSVLQDHLLAPILNIDDPRRSSRIAFVGGARGLKELERRADASQGVAFALYPCSLGELFSVADKGKLMPPKSTWFEPKPRSGLFIHKI